MPVSSAKPYDTINEFISSLQIPGKRCISGPYSSNVFLAYNFADGTGKELRMQLKCNSKDYVCKDWLQ
jgi:hypothetical protein